MSELAIKVTGPRSYTKRIKIKGLEPKKKITVSKDTQKLVGIRRALNNHATRLLKAEGQIESITCRMARDGNDIDTLYIEKEQLYRRNNVLLAIDIIEFVMILTLAILWMV